MLYVHKTWHMSIQVNNLITCAGYVHPFDILMIYIYIGLFQLLQSRVVFKNSWLMSDLQVPLAE